MSDEKIVLVARLKVKPEAVEEAKKMALELVDDSRAEEGCLNYDVHQAIDDSTVFVWHETWRDRAAFNEHLEKPYFKDFFARASELAAEDPQIILTRMISEK